MYQPAHFQVLDEAPLMALMQSWPLASVVRHSADGTLDADHIPLQFNAATRSLRGHVARANPLWRQARDAGAGGMPVLAMFRAEQGYISPNGYPSKAQTHKVVPTWNYAVVHVHGRLKIHDDAAWLHALVQGLTDQHEQHESRPWSVSDAPADYMDTMLRAIVGVEISVEKLEGKFKLSQNRSASDLQGVVQHLGQSASPGARALAQRMQNPIS